MACAAAPTLKENPMSYRTILVHADMSRHAEARIRLAAGLAADFEGHLVGTALTGVSPVLLPGSVEMGGEMIAEQIDLMQDAAHRALDQFDAIVNHKGLAFHERRYVNDEVDGGIALQARYADLVVVSQIDPSEKVIGQPSGLAEYLLMNTARPVLVIPYTWSGDELGGTAVVAWDGSLEATRAVIGALPLLKRASKVTVLVFDAEDSGGAHGEQPGADLALYLARHGVTVEADAQTSTIDTGNALLSYVADLNTDLLVMGGYGHARLREMLLGGVTRTILNAMTLPVLLAH
jgi:nucleotide-binding universal stress UspA family protein